MKTMGPVWSAPTSLLSHNCTWFWLTICQIRCMKTNNETVTVCRSASNLQLAREELGGGGWVEGGGKPPRQLLLMTRRWRCYFLKKKRFRNKKKRAPSWPGGATSTLRYQKCQFGCTNQRPRLHTQLPPTHPFQHQHHICVLLSGFKSCFRHFFLQNHRTI